MITVITFSLFIMAVGAIYLIFLKTVAIVPEDHNAVIVNRQGFIKRVLPAGAHHLKPGMEKIEFMFETKTRLSTGAAKDISTAEGILLNVNWSAVYARNADFISDKVSQRLRALPKADLALQRQVDLAMRRLLGGYNLQDLFKPAVRARIERQLTNSLKASLKPSGIELNKVDLQIIHLPVEISEALHQAKAIQTLDSAIRASDVATRQVVTGSHRLEELLEWETLLPPYGRYILSESSFEQRVPA